jgi:phosphoribosylamine-glycine ligase
MKFLFCSHGGDGDALALRVQAEGNEVAIWHFKPRARKCLLYDGLVPQPETVEQGLRWKPDVIIFDQAGEGATADRWRRHGYAVWGASGVMDKMELNRSYGLLLMRDHGIEIPETHLFKTADEAIPFIKAHKAKRWVLKPIKGQGAATGSTYPSKDTDDLLNFLEKWASGTEGGQPFLLQEFMDGIEISTEVWVQHGKILEPANATFEEKKYAVGGYGPNIGCASSTVYAYRDSDPHLVRQGIGLLAPWLEKQAYHGVLDLNTIVNPKNRMPYGLEWTARVGYSAIYALAEILNEDLGKILADAAKGQLSRVPLRDGVGHAVRVSIQPYPASELYEDDQQDEIMKPATGLTIKMPLGNRHIWPLDVRLSDKGGVETAGYDGVICEVSARGRTIEEARDAVRHTYELVTIPNAYVRLADSADRAIRDAAKLQALDLETFTDPIKAA